MIYSAIVFLPALGGLIAGLFGRLLGPRPSELITTGLLLVSCVLSWIVFYRVGFGHETAHVAIERWITSGELDIGWAFKIDTLTAVMFVVVTTVSALVHVYSIGYMEEDDSRPRFFAYLSGFTFAMLMLVTSDNLVQMFFGWEGVGLFSYLLIGFWYTKPEANAAAIKAFVVNRVGDFGFALGIFGLFAVFNTVNLDQLFDAAPGMAGKSFEFLGYQVDILTTLSLLLFMGAMGKSAQFLLHTWLPDAMEGPTPVSALIHAATMVTAGVFMVARLSPIFEQAPDALQFVVLIGAITAFFAATVGLVQNDIKRVIAYSTCSQLGYMFVACGVGAYQAGIFHLFTHAFFKALLFLGAGSVIHAMHHEQDMRKMGGLRSKLPYTWALMLIGTLALTGFGIPHLAGFSGFYSKDTIIEAAHAAHTPGDYAFWALVIAAFMTSFYSWRLMFMTFHGPTRADKKTFKHAHESPPVMLVPLAVLALGAVVAGVGDAVLRRRATSTSSGARRSSTASTTTSCMPCTRCRTGCRGRRPSPWPPASSSPTSITSPCRRCRHSRRAPSGRCTCSSSTSGTSTSCTTAIFVRPTFWLGNVLWKVGDIKIINGLIDGTAEGVYSVTQRAVRLQTGYIYHYAFAMLIGVALLVSYFMFMGGAR